MKTSNIMNLLIVISLVGTIIFGATMDHYEGEVYLQTENEIESWTVRDGIVKTGLTWFDNIAQQYQISELRPVDISCQVSMFFYHVAFNNSYSVADVCDDFNNNQEVTQSWPVFIPEWYAVPNDTYYSNQWGLEQIDAPTAWDYETGEPTVLIGILDTGADVYDNENQQATVHPDLAGNLWNGNGLYGIDLIQPETDTDDGFGHGTHVSGIAGAVTNNSTGVSGVAGGGFNNGDGVSLLIVRNGNNIGNSTEELMAESICTALNPDGNWGTDDWVDIINISWGLKRPETDLPTDCDDAFPLLRLAITEAANRGVILIAAAGNGYPEFDEQCQNWPYPAGYDEVIAVGATSPEDDHLSYSSKGPFLEVSAPGGVGFDLTNVTGGHGIEYDNDDIYSTFPRESFTLQDLDYWSEELNLNILEINITNDYGYSSGTSMASPYVAGLAGLILSRFPSYNAEDVRQLLTQSAEKVGTNSYDGNGWNMYLGYGRISAGYALAPPSAPQNFTVSGNVGEHPVCDWDANSEPDLTGYNLYKNEAGTGWALFQTLNKSTTTYTDMSVTIGQGGKGSDNVCYKVSAVDISNQESDTAIPRCKPLGSVSKELSGIVEILPNRFSIYPAFPNPFNPSTTMNYQIPIESAVSIKVFDLEGRLIATLVNSSKSAGYYSIDWNGVDSHGKMVASGVYLIVTDAISLHDNNKYHRNQKVILMK